MGFRFYDSDRFNERRNCRSIAQIFSEDGEASFREREVEALRILSKYRNVVIATGGGAPMNGLNIARLRQRGIVVLLYADAEEILSRIPDRASRPLLSGTDCPDLVVQSLLESRMPAYRAAAHAVVETTGLSREDATTAVLDAYRRCAGDISMDAKKSKP